MANQTKAQLTDELIRLRAHSDRIEIELAKATERNALLARQLERAVEQSTVRQAHVPAYRAAAEHRRALSRAYFKANPDARSVTDEQLRDFESTFDVRVAGMQHEERLYEGT